MPLTCRERTMTKQSTNTPESCQQVENTSLHVYITGVIHTDYWERRIVGCNVLNGQQFFDSIFKWEMTERGSLCLNKMYVIISCMPFSFYNRHVTILRCYTTYEMSSFYVEWASGMKWNSFADFFCCVDVLMNRSRKYNNQEPQNCAD